jgi:Tfp pilus assembly protein PilZ
MAGEPVRARRIAVVEPCEIEGNPSTVWNLSAGGLYVVIDPPPEVGLRVRIAFRLPNEQKPVQAEARIAWRNPRSARRGRGSAVFGLPPGCGLEFLVIDAVDLERIKRYVGMTPVLRRNAGWRRTAEGPDS